MENEDKIEWLCEIAGAMYGEHWKPSLAKQLGINDRSVRQWANGERTIPDTLIRGLLSLAHDRASMIARSADHIASEMRSENGYQRIIYNPELRLNEIRPDLYTENRAWFDIDGRLFALNDNGIVIDIHGAEADYHGVSTLPDGVTIEDLLNAKNDFIKKCDNYD